jgi:glycerol uptake facilitator-like aquaporin
MTERRTGLAVEAAASAVLVAIVLSSGLGSALERRSVVAALVGSLFVGYGTSVLLLTSGSGGHLNPLVTLASVSQGSIRPMKGLLFCVAQLLGASIAAAAAGLAPTHLPPTLSPDLVAFPVPMLREFIAAFGLLLVVWGISPRVRTTVAAATIGTYLAVTFWMTGSSLFANPLVVIALLIADPDKGVALTTATAALTGQVTGAAGGTLLARGLFGPLRRVRAQGRM